MQRLLINSANDKFSLPTEIFLDLGRNLFRLTGELINSPFLFTTSSSLFDNRWKREPSGKKNNVTFTY
jgi:hypothetical protein